MHGPGSKSYVFPIAHKNGLLQVSEACNYSSSVNISLEYTDHEEPKHLGQHSHGFTIIFALS